MQYMVVASTGTGRSRVHGQSYSKSAALCYGKSQLVFWSSPKGRWSTHHQHMGPVEPGECGSAINALRVNSMSWSALYFQINALSWVSSVCSELLNLIKNDSNRVNVRMLSFYLCDCWLMPNILLYCHSLAFWVYIRNGFKVKAKIICKTEV